SGLAPIRSPAATNTELATLARKCLTSVAMCSAPPADTLIFLVRSAGSAIRMPPGGGLRWPWKSLTAMIVSSIGAFAASAPCARAGAPLQAPSRSANASLMDVDGRIAVAAQRFALPPRALLLALAALGGAFAFFGALAALGAVLAAFAGFAAGFAQNRRDA